MRLMAKKVDLVEEVGVFDKVVRGDLVGIFKYSFAPTFAN